MAACRTRDVSLGFMFVALAKEVMGRGLSVGRVEARLKAATAWRETVPGIWWVLELHVELTLVNLYSSYLIYKGAYGAEEMIAKFIEGVESILSCLICFGGELQDGGIRCVEGRFRKTILFNICVYLFCIILDKLSQLQKFACRRHHKRYFKSPVVLQCEAQVTQNIYNRTSLYTFCACKHATPILDIIIALATQPYCTCLAIRDSPALRRVARNHWIRRSTRKSRPG